MAKLVFSRSTAFQVLMPITVNRSGFCSSRTSSGPPELPASTCAGVLYQGELFVVGQRLNQGVSIRHDALSQLPRGLFGQCGKSGREYGGTVGYGFIGDFEGGYLCPLGKGDEGYVEIVVHTDDGAVGKPLGAVVGQGKFDVDPFGLFHHVAVVMMYSRLSCLLR